jgi:hypothetical protein
VSWRLSGSYLEVCNCDAICPCRRIGGVAGGRSSYGECTGALSWWITEGEVDGVDVSSLAVVLVLRYHDDEPGSPWTWMMHVDERAAANQRALLADVFTGRRGGTPLSQFPWVFKESTLLAIVPSRIDIDHTPGRGWFRAGGTVDVRIAGPYPEQTAVTCIIPGHDRSGREVIAERMHVDDEYFRFECSGRCGYEATFEYASGPE